MKIRWLKLLGLLLLATPSLPTYSVECSSVKQVPTNKDYVQSQEIADSGLFCLRENLEIKRIASHGHSPRTSSSILRITAGNVALDLRGHSAWSDADLEAGIDTSVSYLPESKVDAPPTSITLRNGQIRLTRRGAGISMVGLGGVLNGAPTSVSSDFAWTQNRVLQFKKEGGQNKEGMATILAETANREKSAAQDARTQMPNVSDYLNRKIVIENMTIKTRRVGIVIQGAGTVIRNSVIEVDSGTAIWLFGPNSVIENNTIIVRGESEPKVGLFLLEADAPIRLHHGDGALVRNNRIIIASKANRRAISLFDTGPIRIESNTIFGLRKDDEAFTAFLGRAQFTATSNLFEPYWKSWLGVWR
jgi:Right handed beta helix region